eukprot:43835-Chlamydomonas_euryale.AAC.2
MACNLKPLRRRQLRVRLAPQLRRCGGAPDEGHRQHPHHHRQRRHDGMRGFRWHPCTSSSPLQRSAFPAQTQLPRGHSSRALLGLATLVPLVGHSSIRAAGKARTSVARCSSSTIWAETSTPFSSATVRTCTPDAPGRRQDVTNRMNGRIQSVMVARACMPRGRLA